MASKEVKELEASGACLDNIIWTAEKPFMLVKENKDFGGVSTSFFSSRNDFDFAVAKAERNNEEVMYAAEILCFKKVEKYKSGFGRNSATSLGTYSARS